ncbi:MAG: hypothetical protein KAV00_15090, partial [Phycisphaerae bacterium]|nr:hypothetical protein [Phycisphaerae bacterium]
MIQATFLFTRAAGFSGRVGAGGLSDIFGSIDTYGVQGISPLAADRRARASRSLVGTERRSNTPAEPNCLGRTTRLINPEHFQIRKNEA